MRINNDIQSGVFVLEDGSETWEFTSVAEFFFVLRFHRRMGEIPPRTEKRLMKQFRREAARHFAAIGLRSDLIGHYKSVNAVVAEVVRWKDLSLMLAGNYEPYKAHV